MKSKEKVKALNDLSDSQLQEKLKELGSSLLKTRFELKTGHVENVNIVRETRKDIARVKTIITARAKVAGATGAKQ